MSSSPPKASPPPSKTIFSLSLSLSLLSVVFLVYDTIRIHTQKARPCLFSPRGEREGGQKQCIPPAAASGTETHPPASGAHRAVAVVVKPSTAWSGGGNTAAAHKPAARRRAGSLRSVYVGEQWHIALKFAAKVRKVLDNCSIRPHLFIYILRQNAGGSDVFRHFRPPVLSATASIRREAVTALQGVLEAFGTSVSLRRRADALHVVGSQGEVEDVVVLGDVGLYAAALVVGVRLVDFVFFRRDSAIQASLMALAAPSVLQHGRTDGRNLHHAVNVVLVEVLA